MKQGTLKKILAFQKNEITEHLLYAALARRFRGKNGEILKKISDDELAHHHFFKKITGEETRPSYAKLWLYRLASRLFGITFTLKMMSNSEEQAEHDYGEFEERVPGLKKIIRDEVRHEEALVGQVEEGIIRHLGSMVLAVNNSIQEITGIVVGLTFALSSALLVGKTALISGMAATLAMVASEYLSQKAETGDAGEAAKAALYTGIVYILVVTAIVSPYFIFSHHFTALAAALGAVSLILSVFTFFMSVVRNLPYRKALLEVVSITAAVVVLSLGLGMAVKLLFG